MIFCLFHRVALDYVNAKKEAMKSGDGAHKDNDTLLGIYLSSDQLDTKDVVTIVSDMLLAGIETVGISIH